MGNGRFALARLAMKPEDPGCSSICVVDPVDDFFQDLSSCAIKTFLLLVQPDSGCVNQEVQTEVFPDLLHVICDIAKCPITKLLNQVV